MGVNWVLRLYLYHGKLKVLLWLWAGLSLCLALAMIWSGGYVWFRRLLAIVVIANLGVFLLLNLAIDALRRYRDFLIWRADAFWDMRMLGFQFLAGMAVACILLFRDEYAFLGIPLMCSFAAYVWGVSPSLSRLGRAVRIGRKIEPNAAELDTLRQIGSTFGFDVLTPGVAGGGLSIGSNYGDG
jgi:hypothetical protein